MKKLFTILAVMTAVTVGVNAAQRLMDESFDYSLGNLAYGDYQKMGSDQSNWWYMTGTADIQVVNANLTKAGYQSKPAGKAAQLQKSNKRDIRAFNGVSGNGKSVYYSFLLNVDSMNTSTSKQYIMGLTGTSSASGYAALYGEVRLTYKAPSSFQIGVTKANEAGVRYASNAIPFDSTVLVVVRYDFIEGEKNDECYMWINPTTLDESKPTTQCVQDTSSSSSNPIGANQKVDPSALSIVNLSGSSCFPSIFIDEVRVATKWADLFEGGGTEPGIGVASSLDLGSPYQGEIVSKVLKITGQNLPAGISISYSNSELSLSASSFTKAQAEAGAELTVTLNAQKVGAFVDTIVLTSDTIVKKVVVGWVTNPVTACANIAALKAVTVQDGNYRLTGEVVVTRDTIINDAIYGANVREIFIQDATGATKIKDKLQTSWDAANLVGSKIKDFIVTPLDTVSSLVSFDPLTKPTVVSTGNTVEPQVVTLAELQANGADYLLEVVKIKNVSFADAGGSFAGNTQYEVSQGSETANVKVEMGVGISGSAIPSVANVVGFSWNVSGTVIVPRSGSDISDAALLKNGSFEEYTTSTFMQSPYASFNSWSFGNAWGANVNTTDKLDGEVSFTTTSLLNTNATLYQSISCADYVTNDEFKLRICYKNLNDSSIKLDSYWAASAGGSAIEPVGDLKQVLPKSAEWDTIEILTVKPEKAIAFELRVTIPKKTLVLLDNFGFEFTRHIDEPTAVEESSKSSNSSKCSKVIRNGQMLIIRDGVIYNVAGQKL